MITKDLIPNSRNKDFQEKRSLLQGPYTVPGALETATSLLMHHAKTKEKLYPNSPNTYTSCQEKPSDDSHVLVGSFGSSGPDLRLHFDNYRDNDYGLGGSRHV